VYNKSSNIKHIGSINNTKTRQPTAIETNMMDCGYSAGATNDRSDGVGGQNSAIGI
jgi:hypothetical protein